MGDIVDSQIQYGPASFISCLENLVEKYIPGGYIIVKSAWDFNYSFAEISQYIKNMLVYSHISIDSDFPEHLVPLSFSRVNLAGTPHLLRWGWEQVPDKLGQTIVC